MTNPFLSDLSQDIGRLFSARDNYDLIIQAGEGQNMKKFFVHSLILSTRSTYFKTALSKEWARKENGIIIFKKPNISPKIFELILNYLYSGNVDLSEQNGAQMLKFVIATDELNLQKLSDYIQVYLIDNQAEFLRNDPIEILQEVFQLERLKNYCLGIICENPKMLFESPKFVSLDQDLIIFILKQNELEIEEIEIWEYILKWALVRMSTQHNIDNLSQWTSSNFKELEKILHDLIPHIRWFQIPAEVFHKKISLFEPIFSKQLYKDIIKHNFDPSTSSNNLILPQRFNLTANSVLIDKDHLYTIASWIDKKVQSFYESKNIPYSFKLIYRASRDGFEAVKFHELCDDKGPTIMISKLQNDRLIGGYNPSSWKPHGWKESSDSFLFSFTKREDINSGFIVRVTNNIKMQQYAIYYSLNYGPAFGDGHDLIINKNNIKIGRYNSTYPGLHNIIKKGIEYTIEDYEVFQVIHK